MTEDVPSRAALALPNRALPLDRVQIMGILNRTPDSFYDQGRFYSLDLALTRARDMIAEGADIIDVGGEKAGPGAPVSPENEIDRVVPVIEAIRAESSIVLSVDTIKPEVASAAVAAGADIINSIGGFDDPALRRVAAHTRAAGVIMHIQGKPRVANPTPTYGDVVAEVRDWLVDRTQQCIQDGMKPDSIVIDPGPGFGKSTAHDLTLVSRLSVFTALPYPVLLAVSRKGFIGDILSLPPAQRLEGSLAATSWGVLTGAAIVRTHDVRPTKRAVQMAEAVLRGGE